MARKIVLAFLCSIGSLMAQVPTNFSATELTGQTNLGTILKWDAVVGATYNVYRAPSYDCGGKPIFEQIASGLSATTYTDQPSNPPLPLGFLCYGVTSVVSGIESAKAEASIGIGDKGYWTIAYRLADCHSASTQSTTGTNFQFLQTRSGVTTTLIDKTSTAAGSTANFGGFVRLYDDATYSLQFTMPDGKVFKSPMAFTAGVPVSAIESQQYTDLISPTDTFCFSIIQETLQPATSNE